MTPAPFPLRRVIACARALMARQGLPRRRAIAAALVIVGRAAQTGRPAPTPRPVSAVSAARKEAALEYLTHRNRSMSGAR